jgi:hypothetical protein
MKKFLLSLATVLCAGAFASADEVTITPNSSTGFTGDANSYTASTDGFTLTYTKGSNDCVAPSSDHIRIYKSGTFIITGEKGQTITKVVMTSTGKNYAGFNSASEGTGSWTTSSPYIYTWTGSAKGITFTSGASQTRIKSIVITYTPGSGVQVEQPVIAPTQGVYGEAQEITITSANNKIYYTTDGTKPSDASEPYTGPFTVSESSTVKAIAYDADDNTSLVSTAIIAIAEGAKGNGTETSPYNPIAANAGALAGMTNSVYIEGIIVSVKSIDTGSHGNAEYYISADGTEKDQLYIYRGYGLNGAKFTSAEDLKPGMKVTVNGSLSTYQNVPQIGTGSKIVELDTNGVEDIEINENAPVEYFNLQGVRVENPANGLYIMRQGDKVVKVIK